METRSPHRRRRPYRPALAKLVRRGAPADHRPQFGAGQQSGPWRCRPAPLEIYAQLGIADRALELGKSAAPAPPVGGRRAQGPHSHGRHRRRAEPLSLRAHARPGRQRTPPECQAGRAGIAVQWNTELVGFDQGPTRDVTLRRPDGRCSLTTTHGSPDATGRAARVRELCGIGFPGEP